MGVAPGADGRGTIDTEPTGAIVLEATGAIALEEASTVVEAADGMRTVDGDPTGGMEYVALAAGMTMLGVGIPEAETLDEAEGTTGVVLLPPPGADVSKAMILSTACSATTATMA